MHTYLNRFVVHLKLIQHYESTIIKKTVKKSTESLITRRVFFFFNHFFPFLHIFFLLLIPTLPIFKQFSMHSKRYHPLQCYFAEAFICRHNSFHITLPH